MDGENGEKASNECNSHLTNENLAHDIMRGRCQVTGRQWHTKVMQGGKRRDLLAILDLNVPRLFKKGHPI